MTSEELLQRQQQQQSDSKGDGAAALAPKAAAGSKSKYSADEVRMAQCRVRRVTCDV